MDGTNASDDAGDRPGMRALKEMKVLSPLRLSGVTKASVRNIPIMQDYSHGTSLLTPVLATRVPAGVSSEASVLKDVEWAEKSLADLGFRDFRVRVYQNPAGGAAKASSRGVRSSSSPRT